MIHLTEKRDCCGCSACVQRCPKHCISLREDTEGFLYPHVDASECIDCGLCEQVCPMLHQSVAERKPLAVYAAKNKNEEVRQASSSGGIFTALAEEIIREGGVVFGACFSADWEVVHDYTETVDGLARFRGSKYVQSRMGDSYMQAEAFLKAGRKVLFSGTPCQIAGLKKFLRKDYANLLAVDVICHGVPSPGVWREYLKEEIARQRDGKNTVLPRPIHEKDVLVEGISFRDKTLGWQKYSFALVLSTTNGSGEKFSFCSRMPLNENLFLRGFLADLYLRPSCYACPLKCGKSGSDMTLGDFWGLQDVFPELDDDKGMTALLVNSVRGKEMLGKAGVILYPTDYEKVLRSNPALERSVTLPSKRLQFYAHKELTFADRICKCTRLSIRLRIRRRLSQVASRILGEYRKEQVKKIFRKELK